MPNATNNSSAKRPGLFARHLTKGKLLIILFSIGILVFSVLYLLAVSPYWKITPDSTVYVLAAESIAAGEGYTIKNQPVPVVPPMTSLIFSLCIFFFPGSYLALNGTVTALALGSVLLAFILFKYDTEAPSALALCSMCIASTVLFAYSTFLLSDIVYLFFSLLALVVIQQPRSKGKGWPTDIVIGMLLLAACMTRIVGLALVSAIILSAITAWLTGRAAPRPVLMFMLLLVMISVGLLEYRNLFLDHSNFQLFLQKDPWVDESGYVSAVEFGTRFFKNSDRYEGILTIFANGMLEDFGRLQRVLLPLTACIFLLGLVISMTKASNVAAIYTGIYLWLIATFQGDAGIRYFVPVIPFLFYYSFVGVRFIKTAVRRATGPMIEALMSAGFACYVAAYILFGFTYMVRVIPAQHKSPFGRYAIKYTYNYDTQRLALWLKDHSSPSDAYLAQHPNMMDIMTQRKGYKLPLTRNPQTLLELLSKNRIRYVIADKTKDEAQRYLFPVIMAHPDKFNLIRDETNASLYRFEPPPEGKSASTDELRSTDGVTVQRRS